jgi:DNA adenine methylase
MKKKIFVKSPTRTPGGKSKALDFLIPYVPEYKTYMEPFVGGGSLFLRLSQMYPDRNYHINDLFFPQYSFWKTLYEQPMTMMNYILQKKNEFIVNRHEIVKKGIASSNAENGKKLHAWCRKEIENVITNKDEFHTACLWYILNKTSFSGMSMIGSYAKLAWDQNFTDRCIFNLPKIADLMHNVKSMKITNLDYSELLSLNGENIFIFLDPPYKIIHNLYGKDGNMHEQFNHQLFSDKVKECKHKWMITYNQDEDINLWFPSPPYFKYEWNLTYTMKAAKRKEEDRADIKIGYEEGKEPEKSGKKDKELLILNYDNPIKK